jgi:hypothetical protein
MRLAVLPLESVSSMLWICTAMEVTLAMGASVPTTKAGPVEVDWVEEFMTEPLVQPVTRIAAADSKRIASLKGVFLNWGDISYTSLSASCRSL